MRLTLILLSLILLSSCVWKPFTEGHMINGHIQGCAGNHSDSQACGNAIFNAPRLQKLALGQSKQEVLAIMEHPAERSEAEKRGDHVVEAWAYMQNYDAEAMTAVVFTDGVVTALRTVPWRGGLLVTVQ